MLSMAKKNKQYQYPYSTFVRDDDLKGIIAYSIYKRSKIEYRKCLDNENLSEEEYFKKT